MSLGVSGLGIAFTHSPARTEKHLERRSFRADDLTLPPQTPLLSSSAFDRCKISPPATAALPKIELIDRVMSCHQELGDMPGDLESPGSGFKRIIFRNMLLPRV